MTQIIFTVNEEVTASRLNQATQGFKFIRRTTYAGSSGSPVGLGTVAVATWNIGSGTAALYVRVCGGGGGSEPCQGGGTGVNTSGVSGGGGGGGYSERWILSGFGTTQVVNIGLGGRAGILPTTAPGNGGESRFGTFLSAGGGGVSGVGNSNAGPAFIGGGIGGIGSGGNINAAGISGGIGFIISPNSPLSGRGGQSAFGGAGGAESAATSAEANGRLFGGGAGGAVVVNVLTATSRNGANGAPGFVIVDEYA